MQDAAEMDGIKQIQQYGNSINLGLFAVEQSIASLNEMGYRKETF